MDREKLCRCAEDYGVAVDRETAEKFDRYARLLVEWNERMNLTAITDAEGILFKHFVDSLTIVPFLPEKTALSLIDVGTGAGFPGLPVALVRPEIRLTLLDSLNKRLTFLQAVCQELAVSAEFIHARAEEGGRQPQLREQYDVATARAVASLPVLCEYCLPFVRPGGRFIAMKGPEGEGELSSAEKALHLLGGRLRCSEALSLPKNPQPGVDTSRRQILVFDKTGLTPPRFPRPSAKMAKQPL